MTPQINLRYCFHYRVFVAARTAVDFIDSFDTYNDGILVGMSVGIADATVVIVAIVAVVVGVSRNKFY